MFDSLRHSDPAVDAAWQERQVNRMRVCRAIATALCRSERALAPHLSADAGRRRPALGTLTSLRLWEDLVIGRGWTAERYRSHVTYLAVGALTH